MAIIDRDLGWKKMISSLQLTKGEPGVFVGFPRRAQVHQKAQGMTVSQIAAVHEFGSSDGRIPERSFMRSAMDSNKEKLAQLVKQLALDVTEGKRTQTQALGILGEAVKQMMRSKIIGGLSPPLAPSTVERKGSSKPLVDTGQLLNSIDWEIEEGK